MSTALRGRPSFAADRHGVPAAALFGFAAALSFGAIGAALVTQHVYGMQPCPWCVLQRLIFLAIGVLSVLGLVWRGPPGARVAGLPALLLAAGGFAAAMWQHFVAAATASCKLSFADKVVNATGFNTMLPDVFESRASCADAAVSLFGVPYEFWSATLFVVLAVTMLVAMRRR
jgi:disulfide bond formation protein DsbB